MAKHSILIRVAAAIVFLALGAGLLQVERLASSRTARPSTDAAHAYLIITPATFSPAFLDLAGWVREEGGAAVVLTLEDFTPGPIRLTPPGSEFPYLNSICAYLGYPTMIVGGNEAALGPASRYLRGTIGRAPVGTVDEAWAFVARCRRQGLPLDPLLFDGRPGDLAAQEAWREPVAGAAILVPAARSRP